MTDHVIDRLGQAGDGIAAGPIYAPGTLPGEVVRGTLSGDRLGDIKIVSPSPARVAPPCRHAKSCGGCDLQHAKDIFVADWKVGIVAEALAAHGLAFEMGKMHVSPSRSRRRASLTGQKTKKGALIGYHARQSSILVDVLECQVLDPAILALKPLLVQITRAGGTRSENLRFAITQTANGADIDAQGARALDAGFMAELAELGSHFNVARLSWNSEPLATYRRAEVKMGRARVLPPPGAFLQATPQGEAALVARVRAEMTGAARVVDLFSGCGTFSLPLCETAEVLAVEGTAELLEAAHLAWRETGGVLKKFSVEKRDLFRRPLMPDELARFDGAVLDPPRAGAAAQVAEIAQSDLARLAYVSCSPKSFARDAAQLVAAGFTMGPVDVVDQFRWSTHVELVTGFTR